MRHYAPLFVQKLTSLPPRRPVAARPQGVDLQGLYRTLFNKQLKAQVGPEAYELASRLVAQFYKAVQHCRQHDLVAALAQLHHTDAQMARLPAAAVDFVTLFQLSAWGNYYYKTNEPEQGIAALTRGMHISAELERQGYQVFIYRRIEQLWNMATIQLKQQQYDEAHTLLKNTLTFVHSGRAQGLFIDDWDSEMLQRIRLFQESTLDETFSRVAKHNTALLGHATHGYAYYHEVFFQDLLREMATDTYNRTVLYNWLYVKAAYVEQGPAAFFEYALDFLADPNVAPEYDDLKANLLAQAVWHMQQQPTAQAQPLIASIQHFSETTLADRGGQALKIAA
jgi:hypothetical protein